MDKHQLTTIAVTALISVIAREFIAWMLSIAKRQAALDTTRATARRIFNKYSLLIIWESLVCVWAGFFLVRLVRLAAPVTRLDVFFIAALTVAISFQIALLCFHIGYFSRKFRRRDQ
jgi:hypothetical protein